MHHEEELNQAFEIMEDIKDQLQECAEQCRTEAENVTVTACKSGILNAALACEAQVQSIESCIALCRSEVQEAA